MAVDPWHGVGRLFHDGVEYCFCSLGCAGAFAQDPSRYTASDPSWDAAPDRPRATVVLRRVLGLVGD
ncbi:MAG TPA: hypothetical protein VGW74_08530, partial [Propionibacteriaceae bacterium]|nr:hypothetical protein [Propionibacteriaceae bacterium]